MCDLRDLRRLFEAVQPRSAFVEAEGKLPFYLELTAEADGVDAPFPEFETEGRVYETPSRFESSGFLRVGGGATNETHEVRLVEDERTDDSRNGHVVEGSHVVPAETPVAILLSSHDGVCELVETVLGLVSESLLAALEFEVEEHISERETRGGERFVVSEYAVCLGGLDRLSESGRMRVEEGEVTFSRGDGLACSWEFDLRNHGELFRTLLDEGGYGEADALLKTRRASAFSESLGWRASLSDRDAEAEVSYEAENGPRYTEELAERGFDTPEPGRIAFELETHGTTTKVSFDSETSGGATAELGERLDGWMVLLPLPVLLLLLRLL